MPWPEKQRRAIFLDVKRRKGLKAAKDLMHEAGYGDARKQAVANENRRRKRKRPS